MPRRVSAGFHAVRSRIHGALARARERERSTVGHPDRAARKFSKGTVRSSGSLLPYRSSRGNITRLILLGTRRFHERERERGTKREREGNRGNEGAGATRTRDEQQDAHPLRRGCSLADRSLAAPRRAEPARRACERKRRANPEGSLRSGERERPRYPYKYTRTRETAKRRATSVCISPARPRYVCTCALSRSHRGGDNLYPSGVS